MSELVKKINHQCQNCQNGTVSKSSNYSVMANICLGKGL
jgi:hypothetical protein